MKFITQKHGVEPGDLIRFKETGVCATVLSVCQENRFVEIYVAGDALDHTPSKGFTGVTMSLIHRTAEVISETQEALEVLNEQ